MIAIVRLVKTVFTYYSFHCFMVRTFTSHIILLPDFWWVDEQ